MSNNNAGAISPYDSSIATTVSSFVATVTDTLDDLGADSKQIEAIESVGNELQSEVDQLESKVDDNTDQIDQEQQRRSAEVEGCHNRITRVSNEIEAVEADSEETNPTPDDGKTPIQTPLERVCQLDESTANSELTSNQRRARFLSMDVTDYARKVPAGYAIRSSEIRRVLSAGESATIYSQTVSRVMDFLEKLGNDDVSIKQTQSGERTVVFSERIVDRLDQITSGVTDDGGTTVTETVV